MSDKRNIKVESGTISIDINGEEIKVKLQRRDNAENVDGLYPTLYLATAYYDGEPFDAQHSEKEKAVNAIEIQIKRYIKENK